MSTRPRSTLRCPPFLVAPLVLLSALPATAQERPPEPFLESIEVSVVNVEVVVTDRDGHPVHGLTRGDFVVREDGKPVELSNFYAVEGGRRAVPEDETATGTGGGGYAPLPTDQRLNLVVLIDNLNISPTSRNRFLKELEARLETVLRPGDRTLVASADPEVRVVQPFTDDVSAVSAALDRLKSTAPRSGTVQAETRLILRDLQEGVPQAPGGAGLGTGGETRGERAGETLDEIRTWAAAKHTQDLRLLGTLSRFVDALGGLPGRRAVIYVSDGFAVRPAEPLLQQWYEVFADQARQLGVLSPQSEGARWDATSELARLTDAAAGSRVAFYTLRSGSPFGDSLDPQVRRAGTASGEADFLREGALTDLAWRTGGVALAHGDSVDVLVDRMASDYRDYYSLGYRSPHADDGKLHEIEVDVPGRKLTVRHTQGFRATSPEQETVERTLSALVFDAADNPLDVRVELGREQPDEKSRYVLPVLVRVPIASITLLPRESKHDGRLSVVVAVQDADGRLSAPQRIEVPVEIPNERLLQAIRLQVAKGINLLVRKGESKLAVGVRDELSGVTSTLNLDVSVGEGR